jgi:hypothetical protein
LNLTLQNHKVALIVLFLAAIVVVSTVVTYIFWFSPRFVCGNSELKFGISPSYNATSNSVMLNITSWVNQTFVFNKVTLKDSNGQILTTADFSATELPAYKSIKLAFNLTVDGLTSGRYYPIRLYTTEGDSYDSSLTLYENVKTHVSFVDAHTVSVTVQSFANQTIIFEKATINDWTNGNTFERSVDTVLSDAKLLPNETLSLTLNYNHGFSLGNYTLLLYSSHPQSQYVSGAYSFFAVTGYENFFKPIAAIEKIDANNSDTHTLIVNVHSLTNQPVVFTDATVKQRQGDYIQIRANGNPSPTELSPYGNATITVNFNNNQGKFTAGNYTLTLYSGENVAWAVFNVP